MWIRIVRLIEKEMVLCFATEKCNLWLKYKNKDNEIIEYSIKDTYDIEMENLEFNDKNIIAFDTWNKEIKDSLKDSPQRFEEPLKSRLDLLEEKVLDLEQEVEALKKAG